MKKVVFALLASLLLLSCKKDDILIKGVIVNELTGAPIPNISVGAFKFGDAYFSLEEPYISYHPNFHSYDVTAADGSFSFTLTKGEEPYYLASDNSGEWYNSSAVINGSNAKFYLWVDGNVVLPNDDDGYLQLANNSDFTIKLYPKPLCHFDFPPIPNEWGNSGMYIFSNIVTMYIFNLNDSAGLQQIKNRIYGVAAQDQHVRGNFKVVDKASQEIHKEGEFDVFCPTGDTTTVWLNW